MFIPLNTLFNVLKMQTMQEVARIYILLKN